MRSATLNEKKFAKSVLTDTDLNAVILRNKYMPEVCVSCGKKFKVGEFKTVVNGFPKCLMPCNPLGRNRRETASKIFTMLVNNMVKDAG